MGQMEQALRERLEMAGCYVVEDAVPGAPETWFTPHLNRRFTFSGPVTTADDANAILRAAGMEDAF